MSIDTSNMCFVFGSNMAGIHGAGAAAYAVAHRGAKFRQAIGRQGQSYAIPTKRRDVRTSLGLESIYVFVQEFLDYARAHPELKFQVTAIGCGLAGFTRRDIAPMFVKAPDNCYFDNQWIDILGYEKNYWGMF